MKASLAGCACLLLATIVTSCGGKAEVTAPTASSPCNWYPDQATSRYVLPYPVGDTHWVYQGNCGSVSHFSNTVHRYAYDFHMEIGSPVVAAAAGRVARAVWWFPNTTRVPEEENFIMLDHGGGLYSYYSHLDQDGVFVAVDEIVTQGQAIGRSGISGTIVKHLHFQVFQGDGMTIPVTFRNTRPHPNGLVQGEIYAAEPY